MHKEGPSASPHLLLEKDSEGGVARQPSSRPSQVGLHTKVIIFLACS